jgi:hypothetical protein
MHDRLGKADLPDAFSHLHPRHWAIEIMPHQPPAGHEHVIRFAAIVQDVLQVMPAIDEYEVQRRQPAQVIRHRISRDEERLVGSAEVIREPSPLGVRRHLDLLLGRASDSAGHAADKVERENLGIIGRPVGQIGGHMPECRADFKHAPGLGMAKKREYGSRIIVACVAAKRAIQIGTAEARQEMLVVYADDARRGCSGRRHVWPLVGILEDRTTNRCHAKKNAEAVREKQKQTNACQPRIRRI